MALPRYPALKAELERWFLDIFQAIANKELGPFADAQHLIQHEGTSWVLQREGGNRDETEYQEIAVETVLAAADIRHMNINDAVMIAVEKAKELGAAQMQYHLRTLNAAIEKSGNVVDGQGQPLTLDLLLELLEGMHVSFDESGNAEPLTLIVPPALAPRVRELMIEAEHNESAKARYEQIIERKRAEWSEEQDRRKLVD